MQRTMKLGLGAAVLAVAAHGGFWFYGTQQMQKQLAVYAAVAQQKGDSFTYEATATGYPWKRELALRNVSFHGVAQQGKVESSFTFANGLVIAAGNGVTDRSLTITGANVPFTFLLKGRDAAQTLQGQGQMGRVDIRGPLMWNPANHNTVTSRVQAVTMVDADKTSTVRVGDISQTITTMPTKMGSVDYRMVVSDVAMVGQAMVEGQKIDSSGSVKSLSIGGLMTGVSSSAPVMQLFSFKVNDVASSKISDSAASAKQVNETMKLGSFALTANTLEREGFMDFLLKLSMGPLTATGNTASLMGDMKEATCTLSYNNMPRALFTSLQEQMGLKTDAEIKAHEHVVMGQVVEAMVKDDMNLGVDECAVTAKAFNADLKGMLSATADGHPNVMLRLKASGDMVAGLNAMKNQMLPQTVSETAAADKMDISVLTISNTLMMDGQPIMPLPRIQDVLGVEMPAAVAPAAMVTPTAP